MRYSFTTWSEYRRLLIKGFGLILSIFIFSLPLAASNDHPKFEEGVEAFKNDSFQLAIVAFNEVLQDSLESVNLYYNLGLSYQMNEQIGNAVLHYEKALKLDPGNKQVVKALNVVNEKVEVQIAEIPGFFLLEWYYDIISIFSARQWAVLQLVIGAVLLVLIYVVFFKYPDLRIYKLSVAIVVGLLAIIILFSVKKTKYEKGGDSGVVMVEQTNLYQAPDPRSELISEVSEGVKIEIIDQIGDWFKVMLADRDIGWIRKDEIEQI